MTDFCIYTGSACSSPLDRVRTVVYYWQVPYLGSVVLLRSPRIVNYAAAEITAGATHPCTNLTTLDYTNIAFGLFPPLTGRVKKADKRAAYSARAKQDLAAWLPHAGVPVAGAPGHVEQRSA